jgi:tetratricopeptide (TPR) repeat protein
MIPTSESYRSAARSTPALVGRHRIMEEIRGAIEGRADTVIFHITGEGGIGKTRLLTEVLGRCREGVWQNSRIPLFAGDNPIDLYHTQTHALEGLVRAMGAVLPSETQQKFFSNYADVVNELERKKPDLRFALREISDLRERMAKVFIEDFRRLAQQKRVVLAFDTAEMLVYETDAIQRMLRLGAEGAGVRPWLIEQLLPEIPNAVILIAGRPREQLVEDLKQHLHGRLQVITLNKFDEAESLEYFDQVAAAARADGEEDVAGRIDNIPRDSRQVLHILADGRPILLSLAMDLIAIAKRLPDEVKMPLSQARAMTAGELRTARDKLEYSTVSQFQQIGSPVDEAIRSLAFARKGMDPVLLGRVAGMTEEEAKQVLSALTGLSLAENREWPLAISRLRPLSFVKIRPADKRVFLHDEMYVLMQKHVVDYLPDADSKRAQRIILDYYAEELSETRDEIATLQPIAREEVAPDQRVVHVAREGFTPELLEERTKKQIYLNYLLSEQVHYWLRYEPLAGFQTYYRYAEDAYEAADPDLDMQLRDELLVFINAPEHAGQTNIGGLRRTEVELDAGIRWIKRSIRTQSLYSHAEEIAQRLRAECSDLLIQGGDIGQARLDAWEGMSCAYMGDLEQAERLLRRAVEMFRGAQPEGEFGRWQKTLELSNAYNSLGYLLVRRGHHRDAVDVYKRALPLWRKLGKGFEAEHANTLNNLSWALTELGEFDDAMRYCRDGLNLRRDLGARYAMALSYNTLGQIETRNDQPHRARANCERALSIFRELEMPRGIGMASIALAEAYRRMGTVETVYFPKEQIEKIREAAKQALLAVSIFGPYETWPDKTREKPQVAEPARLVDALIELGCAYRDWAQLWNAYTPASDDLDLETLAHRGEKALREAAQVAELRQPHRAVDALVNLAWLHYYVGNPVQIKAVLQEVQTIVKEGSLISEQTGLPVSEPEQPWQWVQLGKMHVLLGSVAFDRYTSTYEKYREALRRNEIEAEALLEEAHKALRESSREYTLSLAYDELYGHGQVFRDQRSGEAHIYDRLSGLNIDELRIVKEATQSTASKYHLEQPRLPALVNKWFGHLEEE